MRSLPATIHSPPLGGSFATVSSESPIRRLRD